MSIAQNCLLSKKEMLFLFGFVVSIISGEKSQTQTII